MMRYNAETDPCMYEPNMGRNKKPKRDSDDFFLMRKRGLVRNPDYRKFMRGKSTVYEYIWSNIVRDNMNNDYYNIKKNYYDKNFLAYCSTYTHIAKNCYIDKDTVKDYINEFINIGAMKTEKLGPIPKKLDKLGRIIDRRKTVFILGTWHKEIEDGKERIIESYYIDDVFYK